MLIAFFKTGTTLVFFHSEGNFPFSKHDRKVMPSGLQIDSSQIFNIQILIISWPWALFGLRYLIIFKISYVENSTDEIGLHVFLVRTEGSLLFNKKTLPWKKIIKDFSLFLKVYDETAIVQQRWNAGYLFIIQKGL